jgi:hypothetical protein
MSDIHEKIINLLALATNNPSEEEAATAAAMARKLMLKHNIDERDLGVKSSVEYSGGGKLDRDYWQLLMGGIQVLIPVKGLLYGTEAFRWVGTKLNAQVADQLLEFWAKQVEHQYKVHLPPGMSKAERAQYRRDFKRSCALRIIHRARELKATQDADKSTGTALVVIQSQLEREIEEFLADKNITRRKPLTVKTTTRGGRDGYAAGNNVHINTGISK